MIYSKSKINSLKGVARKKELQKERINEYNKNPKKCLLCNKDLSYKKRKNKFCGHSCAASYNNIGVRRNGGDPGNCLNCGKKVKGVQYKYCNSKCQYEYEWRVWCKEIEDLGYFKGMTYLSVGGKVRKPKKYCLEKQNGKCSICGIDSWQGKPVPFVLDHIDGDSTNWKIENIRVICRNCDGQLPTYCGKNRGKSTRKLKLINMVS